MNTPPAGWEDDSIAGSTIDYQLLTAPADDGSTVEGGFKITAQPRVITESQNRIKIMSQDSYQAGEYVWRVYIPLDSAEDDANTGIGCFLVSPEWGDLREIDFETGYGRSDERALYNSRRTR